MILLVDFKTFIKIVDYPESFLSNGGIVPAIYVGTISFLILCIKYNFCWCLFTDRLVLPHSLYNLTNDTDLVSKFSLILDNEQTLMCNLVLYFFWTILFALFTEKNRDKLTPSSHLYGQEMK